MINSFLLIGQSNMAGRGSLQEVEPINNNNIFMFRDNQWVEAEEPLHTDKPEIAGIGLGMSFADILQRKSNKKIGLIPCAFGGTSLGEWQKGEPLYSNAVKETKEALKNSSLKGILWHQGESDSSSTHNAESYKERFLPFINSLTKDIGIKNVPIILGELGEFLVDHDKSIYSHIVNEELKNIGKTDKCFAFVSAKQLTDMGDSLHFDAKSLRVFGERYARKWEECIRDIGISLE